MGAYMIVSSRNLHNPKDLLTYFCLYFGRRRTLYFLIAEHNPPVKSSKMLFIITYK